MPNKDTEFSEQTILNRSYDKTTGVLAVEIVGYDGSNNPVRQTSDLAAEKITVAGGAVYEATAAIASLESDPVWQVSKTIYTNGVKTTWADGNANFDNLAIDLTALTYS